MLHEKKKLHKTYGIIPGFSGSSSGKESACNVGHPSSIPEFERSTGEGIGYPLQYSCLENPHGQRSLAGYSPWGCKELDMTERLSTAHGIVPFFFLKQNDVFSSGNVWVTINCGKFFKRWEYQTTWPASWETYMQVRKQQLERDMEQQTGSK